MAVKERGQKEHATHRVSVSFSDDAYKLLTDIAERKGQTVSGVLRDALALEKLYDETILQNGRILVEREDGSLREVIRP